MNIDTEKAFFRDLKKITDPALKEEIEQTILTVIAAKTIKDIPKLKKVKGKKKGVSYRIRVGSYRIGVTIVGDMLTFVCCLPRKDIYKSFP